MQAALELAVQRNDLPGAEEALRQGADPEKIRARHTGTMSILLAYPRRKNILYPPDASREQDSDLDHALRNGDRKTAGGILREIAQDKSLEQVWQDAVENKRLDVQRAILLLGHADRNRGFRLLETAKVTDPGVVAVMKEIPYFSPKRKPLENFNMAFKFPGTNMAIACRHFVEQRQETQARDRKNKFDDGHYASKEAILANVPYSTNARFDRLTAHAAQARLFYNRDAGKMLARQFVAMQDGKETTQFIALTSTRHAMSVELKIKQEDGKAHYIVEFFDPTYTNSHVRCAFDDLRRLETLTLEAFSGKPDESDYYPESEKISMMFVRPAAQVTEAMANRARGAIANRTLTSSIEDQDISATMLWHMMNYGFAGDLRRASLKEEIAKRPPEERTRLLAAKSFDGVPGLYRALCGGHHDLIVAVRELLPLVPLEQRADLVAAEDLHGVPGLFLVYQNGDHKIIPAFDGLLDCVPRERHAELLAAKLSKETSEFPKGTSGLYIALLNGCADVITALGKVLRRLLPEERAALLTARDGNGLSGLTMGLKYNRVEALQRYLDIIEETIPALSADSCADLLRYMKESHTIQSGDMSYDVLRSQYPELYKNHPEICDRIEALENLLMQACVARNRHPATTLPQ